MGTIVRGYFKPNLNKQATQTFDRTVNRYFRVVGRLIQLIYPIFKKKRERYTPGIGVGKNANNTNLDQSVGELE